MISFKWLIFSKKFHWKKQNVGETAFRGVHSSLEAPCRINSQHVLKRFFKIQCFQVTSGKVDSRLLCKHQLTPSLADGQADAGILKWPVTKGSQWKPHSVLLFAPMKAAPVLRGKKHMIEPCTVTLLSAHVCHAASHVTAQPKEHYLAL